MTVTDFSSTLSNQIDYLASLAIDGLFPLIKRSISDSGSLVERTTALFPTVEVLARAGDVLPSALRDAALTAVLDSRLPNGLWEWEDVSSPPPDLDSTAMAIAVLAKYRSNIVGRREVEVLRSFWRYPLGPFRTWDLLSVTSGHWSNRDTDDPVVNSNALFALQSLGVKITRIEWLAADRLTRKSGGFSRYYKWPSSVLYAAWRVGLGEKRPYRLTPLPEIGTREGEGIQSWAESCVSAAIVKESDLDRFTSATFIPADDEPWCSANYPRMMDVSWSSPAVVTATVIHLLQQVQSGRVRLASLAPIATHLNRRTSRE